MLMVLYSTGMRNAEMRSLQVQDIDSRSSALRNPQAVVWRMSESPT